ncbi:hypothetical protein B0H13DRAFT_2665468 [Mycena leptocephala]|nr:hypothetical protein B0H13DRAFT_2665468 [Mycena leptocephala]
MTAPPAATTGPTTAILIPTTSYERVEEGGYESGGGHEWVMESSITVLCVARAHRTGETLAESAVCRHRATRARWCLRGWVHSSVCAVRQSRTRGEGAELAHTRDWPARCACEAQELEHDGEVYSRSRSRPAPYDHRSLSASYNRR